MSMTDIKDLLEKTLSRVPRNEKNYTTKVELAWSLDLL